MENTLTRNEALDELNLLTTELSKKDNIPYKLKPNMFKKEASIYYA